MPKIVDHDSRRLGLVEVAWRVIARDGIDHATMREIATRAGFTNGALKPYFASKDQLLTFAFEHVFNLTNERAARSTKKLRGLAALRAFCHEVLPLDENRLLEARIVIPFWQKALADAGKAEVYARDMAQWRVRLVDYLRQGRADGTVDTDVADEVVAIQLISMTMGAQILAVLAPVDYSAEHQVEALDEYLRLLGRHC